MWPLLGVLLLGAAPTELTADEKPQPEFKIDVHIVEIKPIKGITQGTSDPELYLHIEPALVVTPADVISIQKRRLRGPTFGTKETGFKHCPRLVVTMQLTNKAKLRLKAAVLESRSRTTTRDPFVGIVINDHYDGTWAKFNLDDSTSGVYWNKFGPRISCTANEEKANRLIEQFTSSENSK